ncbi:MAG: phosphoesterase, partial [Saccharomonospora viridis]
MRERNKTRIGVTALATLAVVASGTAVVTAPEAAASFPRGEWNETAYRGQVEVIPAKDDRSDRRVLRGKVFVDRDRDSVSDPG